jgi:hypothetical protein
MTWNHWTIIMVAALTLLIGGIPATAAANWHEDAFFGLHYDLHPNAGDTELGRETTPEHVRAMLDKVKPDFVQYDCKGHPGYTGYPTKIGSPTPGIINDALQIWRQVTKDMGIPLSIHYSGVWDTRAIELHPEWARRGPTGAPDPNNTCRTSAYESELMIPQLLEVVRDYDIDGMWIDGENWASRPCWCERCKTTFTEKTGVNEIPAKAAEPHWYEWLAFHRELFTQHVTNVANAVHAAKPACLVCSNWMYSVRQPEPVAAPVDYLSGDFDPSFGAARACAEARFIASRGKPWDLMAWSFLQTGNLGWATKTVPHLAQELSVVLAQGGSVFIYDVPQRSGRLTEWHQDLLGQVAEFCRKRQAFCFKTQTIPQVAILHSESSYYMHNDPLFNFASANHALEGALHAVLENGYSADLLNEEALAERMAQYPVVIVPEQEYVPETLKTALREYVLKGGRLLLSGAFVARQYGELAGVEPRGEEPVTGWLPAGNGAVIAGGAYQAVTLKNAAELAPMLRQQDPVRDRLDTPAATINHVEQGVVVAIHGPIFDAYHAAHYPLTRRFIGDALAALDAPNLIRLDGPWWIEMSARQREGQQLIQFVNRSASGYTAPDRHMVENVPDAGSFTITIPGTERPRRCYMAPDETGLEWSWEKGLLTARIGGLGIHNVLVIE